VFQTLSAGKIWQFGAPGTVVPPRIGALGADADGVMLAEPAAGARTADSTAAGVT
jgi:hypothetical protein